jgi:hypothetical protein
VQYALLAYGSRRTQAAPIEGAIAEVLAKPQVTGWARLHADGSATTVRNGEGRMLLTDGPGCRLRLPHKTKLRPHRSGNVTAQHGNPG